MLENIKREPVLLSYLAGDVIALAIAFGLDLSKEQSTAILTLVTLITVIVFGRANVTPNVSVVARDDNGRMVAADASPTPNGTPVDVVPASDEPKIY